MENNPYDAPKADLDHTPDGVAPALWNPNTAASLCIFFSVIFGSYLHMKNWEALGEKEKAASSRKWFFAGVIALPMGILFSFFASDGDTVGGLIRLVFFVFLLSWYFGSAKAQVRFIESRYGKNYPHKGWGKPVLFALLAMAGVVVVAIIAGVIVAALGTTG